MNSAASWVCTAPIIRGVVSNPVYTALLIVALAAIVVMALYHYQIKQAGIKRALRAALYVFLVVLAVVFVHYYAVMQSARSTAAQKGYREVFSSIEQSRTGGAPGIVPVVPMGYEAARAPRPAAPPAPVPGGNGVDCGCPAVTAGPAAARPAAPTGRPDNVAVADFVIQDVIVPATASPLGAARPPKAAAQ